MGNITHEIVSNINQLPEEVSNSPEHAVEWMDNKIMSVSGNWYIAFDLLNRFPIGWIISPVAKAYYEYLKEQALSEQVLTIEQFSFRLKVLGFAKAFINSFAFGIFIITGFLLFRKVYKKT